MDNKLSYLNRNYDEYRKSLIDITRKYYPDVFGNINDASIGEWLIELLSDIGDNLNFHLDRVLQETTIDTANQFSSLQNIARTNGLHIPGKKAALCEIELTCNLPIFVQGETGDGELKADENYAPLIKRGTLFSNGNTTFELVGEVDFKEQFDENGTSNRQIIANRDTNGNIVYYTYKKLALAAACQTKLMKQVILDSDIKPFMQIELQDDDVLGIEGIIVKEGVSLNTDPRFEEFYVDEEEYYDTSGKPVKRFFEVQNLADQYRYGYVTDKTQDGKPIGYDTDINGVRHKNYYNPLWEIVEYADIVDDDDVLTGTVPLRKSVKGEWKRLKNKFITEYTDNWHLKITFGSGLRNNFGEIPENAQDFTKYQMSRMMANDYMGVLPESNTTMFILYKVGGGDISNIAENSLTNIVNLNIEIDGNCDDSENNLKIRNVRDSIRVNNTTPSYGGKDVPSPQEIKYMIKYNSGSQNRCVTLKDYIARINQIPAKYGCPFRVGAVEENNKIIIYALGLDYEGHLLPFLSETVAENIKEYLREYRMINDFVEINSGRIINIAFETTVYIDRGYDKADVTKRIIDKIYDYMDIRRYQMGEDIYLGDLQKEISKMYGVLNLVNLRCFNRVGSGYSDDGVTQQLLDVSVCCNEDYDVDEVNSVMGSNEIDLKNSDYMLFSEPDSMFEVKYKNKDIRVIVKVRNDMKL